MTRRLVFYFAEALFLMIPIGIGLALAASAARRRGREVSLTAARLVVIFLVLALVDTVLGQRFGPSVIPQYYFAGTVLVCGAIIWAASRLAAPVASRKSVVHSP